MAYAIALTVFSEGIQVGNAKDFNTRLNRRIHWFDRCY